MALALTLSLALALALSLALALPLALTLRLLVPALAGLRRPGGQRRLGRRQGAERGGDRLLAGDGRFTGLLGAGGRSQGSGGGTGVTGVEGFGGLLQGFGRFGVAGRLGRGQRGQPLGQLGQFLGAQPGQAGGRAAELIGGGAAGAGQRPGGEGPFQAPHRCFLAEEVGIEARGQLGRRLVDGSLGGFQVRRPFQLPGQRFELAGHVGLLVPLSSQGLGRLAELVRFLLGQGLLGGPTGAHVVLAVGQDRQSQRQDHHASAQGQAPGLEVEPHGVGRLPAGGQGCRPGPHPLGEGSVGQAADFEFEGGGEGVARLQSPVGGPGGHRGADAQPDTRRHQDQQGQHEEGHGGRLRPGPGPEASDENEHQDAAGQHRGDPLPGSDRPRHP